MEGEARLVMKEQYELGEAWKKKRAFWQEDGIIYTTNGCNQQGTNC